VKLGDPTNNWKQCNDCKSLHREDKRIWVKRYGLDTSSCPHCGSVFMAPSELMNRQDDLFIGAAA
jgi:uncharacterized OB-fold protein